MNDYTRNNSTSSDTPQLAAAKFIKRMSEIPSEILKVAEEYGDWDRYILSCEAVVGITNEEKENAREALQNLRQILGENFLRKAILKGHPIKRIILNRALWTRLWLIKLADEFADLSAAEGFPEILRRFKKPDKAVEAESVLRAAFLFKGAGFTVSFEPEVSVIQQSGQWRQKYPDLKLIDDETKEEIIVEVSMLALSASHRRAIALTEFTPFFMLNVLGPQNLIIYAEMSESFDESRVDETVVLLTQLADEAAKAGEFRTIVNEYIVAGIAPRVDEERLKEWASERGVSPGMAGPLVSSDEIARVRMKIRDKLAQLPEDRPGIIAIPVTSSMMFHYYDPQLIVEVLKDEVSRYPRLWGVVLFHNQFGARPRGPAVVMLGADAIINRSVADVLQEKTVILLNESCGLQVSQSSRRKIFEAFA